MLITSSSEEFSANSFFFLINKSDLCCSAVDKNFSLVEESQTSKPLRKKKKKEKISRRKWNVKVNKHWGHVQLLLYEVYLFYESEFFILSCLWKCLMTIEIYNGSLKSAITEVESSWFMLEIQILETFKKDFRSKNWSFLSKLVIAVAIKCLLNHNFSVMRPQISQNELFLIIIVSQWLLYSNFSCFSKFCSIIFFHKKVFLS